VNLWLAKITKVIGRKSQGGGTFNINVTWFEIIEGKWILNLKPSSLTQTYPTQVLLCHLHLNPDMILPNSLQQLAEYVNEIDAYKSNSEDEINADE
jgi:hypothetical protein